MAQSQAYSASVTRNVQTIMDKIVGPGNATVNVQSELNFDQTQIEQKEFIQGPANAKPLYEKQSKETLDGTGNVPQGGVLGPDSTLVPSGNAKSSQKYEATKSETNNAIGERRSVTNAATGAVKRMSVSVIVNSNTAGALNAGVLKQQIVAAAGAVLPEIPSR